MAIPAIRYQNKIVTDPLEKAQIFSSIFAESFSNVPPNPTLPPFKCDSSKILSDITINAPHVSQILKYLPPKNSTSPENIPYIVLKNCSTSFVPNLTQIFRTSLDTGILPRQWKESIIIPLHKKGDKSDPNNYRPISLTSTICRVLERIILYNITAFLNSKNFFSNSQFGFLKKRSTVTQLISSFESWYKSLSNNQIVDIIFIDFKKAFDTFPFEWSISL